MHKFDQPQPAFQVKNSLLSDGADSLMFVCILMPRSFQEE